MMRKWKENRIYKYVRGFLNRVREDHVSAYAAQMAYFVVLTFIPFLLFLSTLVRYTPLTYGMIREAIIGFVPRSLQGMVLDIIEEVYGRSSAVLPISAVVALWTAGKMIQSLINGLNTIYHVKETRNWLINRIYSVFYMILFIIAIVLSLFLLVLGNGVQALLLKYIPFLGYIIEKIIDNRTLLVFSVLFLVFLTLYKVLPNRKASFKSQVPGAFFTGAVWMFFSFGVSVYFVYYPGFTNMYGSLAALVMVMLWLYLCMYIVLLGAEINIYFEKQFRQAKRSVQKRMQKI